MRARERIVRAGALWGMLLAALVCDAQGAARAESRLLYDYQFVSSDNGFVLDDPAYLWEYGVPDPALYGAGVGNVWATGLKTRYIKGAHSVLVSPQLDFRSVSDVTLVLTHAYATDVSTGDCAAALELDPYDDDVCADGGHLRIRDLSTLETAPLSPDGGYPDLGALDGQALPIFAGLSDGYQAQYFDLLNLTPESAALELVFVSNNQKTSTGTGWYISALSVYEGDIIPPELSIVAPLENTYDVLGPYKVFVSGRDNRVLETVTLTWWLNEDGSNREEYALALDPESGMYRGEIPGQPPDTVINYYVSGEDSNHNQARYPLKEALKFEVTLPAPTNLTVVLPSRESTTVELSWTEPSFPDNLKGKYEVVSYGIQHTWTAPDGNSTSAVAVDQDKDPANAHAVVEAKGYPGTDRYGVYALFREVGGTTVWEGDTLTSLPLTVMVPSVQSLSPAESWAGSQLELLVQGTNTRFVAGALQAYFDGNVDNVAGAHLLRVSEIEVIDVTRARLSVEIAPDVPEGAHVLTLKWPGTSTVPVVITSQAFTVLPYGERPRISAVSPESVTQRSQEVIKFTGMNTDFMEGRLAIEFGSGIVAGEPKVLGPEEVEVAVEIAANAPSGARTITLVSGELTFNVDFRVNVQDVTASPGCSTVSSIHPGSTLEGGPWALFMFVPFVYLLLRRRRGVGEFWLRGDHEAAETQHTGIVLGDIFLGDVLHRSACCPESGLNDRAGSRG